MEKEGIINGANQFKLTKSRGEIRGDHSRTTGVETNGIKMGKR